MINEKIAKIAIIGLGYVGLPTAALFADRGFPVAGIDVNLKIVNQVNEGKLQNSEPGLQGLVMRSRRRGYLCATGIPSEGLSAADIIIVCVQTPVDRLGNVNLSFLQKACEDIAGCLKKNRLVIIQSTVPPKTINTVVLPTLEGLSGLKCGEDFRLAYCPERITPGKGLNDLSINTRLIGAYDSESANLCSRLFQLVTSGRLIITDIPSAEVSKLAENAFRYVNIAFANELALLCKQIGVDAKEVIALANTHPRVSIHQPGCGAGGPCLSKDTHLLMNSVQHSDFRPCVLSAAVSLNNSMPRIIAELALSALNKAGKNVVGSKVVILGTAYKGDVDDSRDSPAEGIVRELKQKHAKICVFDPHCPESYGEPKAKNLAEAVKDADCIIIAADHKEFSKLDLFEIKQLMKDNPIIVDAKRIINPVEAKHFGFEYVTTSCVAQGNTSFC